jgi:hypothetical protein
MLLTASGRYSLCAILYTYSDQYLSNKPTLITDTTSIMAMEGEIGCPRCGGKVYAAEEVLAKGRVS